jgi:HAD superfamily hydrolase (TIGR01509 family)
MNFELIIFDCDGVLIDSEVIANRVDVDLLASLGLHINFEEYLKISLGKTLSDTMLELEKRFNKKLPADYPEQVMAYKKLAFSKELKAMDGITGLLNNLHLPKAVASGSSPERLEHSLKVTNLWSYFDPHIYSATMVKHGKPAPDLFLFTAEKFKASPSKTLIIEDSTSGVQAAVAAGMTAIGFTGGSHIKDGHADKLYKLGASKVFSRMQDAADWLGL